MLAFRFISLLVLVTALSVSAQTVPTVSRTISTQTLAPGGTSAPINLAENFSVPGLTGQVALFDTVLGRFGVDLRADAAPRHVANFLSYVQSSAYTNSFFHRSAVMDASGAIGIVQGGGFLVRSTGVDSIPSQASVPLEYNLPNERGTIAAARTSDINSATSQWYFNVRDNSTVLGQGNGGGYTVFGRVIGSGMSVVDAIAALPRINAGSAFTELPVRNYTSGQVDLNNNLVIVNSIRAIPLFADATGPGWISFTAQSSAPNVVTAAVSGSNLTLTSVGGGSATITVRATDVNGNSVETSFVANVITTAPVFTAQPEPQTTIASGNTVVLSAGVMGATSYQWQRNGVNIPGATNATIVINNAGSANAGTYTLRARNSIDERASNAAVVNVANVAPAEVGRLVNLSIRSNAGTADQTLIVGFVLGGFGTSGSSPLLLRAVGPSLAPLGVMGALADPIATLYTGETVFGSNNNWGSDAGVDARAKQVGAFTLPAGSLDAALAVSPPANGYTMQVTGSGGSTGIALAEIYDATAPESFIASSPRLINVSARTQVGTGDNVLISGFAVRGSTSKTVLIRAVGPALIPLGVNGVLADPRLRLTRMGDASFLATNDDWAGDPNVTAAAASVGAFPLANGASKDAALLITLPPGNYTAEVSGANGGTGVALIEVYEVQ